MPNSYHTVEKKTLGLHTPLSGPASRRNLLAPWARCSLILVMEEVAGILTTPTLAPHGQARTDTALALEGGTKEKRLLKTLVMLSPFGGRLGVSSICGVHLLL